MCNGESCYGGNKMDIKKINKIVKTDIKERLKKIYLEGKIAGSVL